MGFTGSETFVCFITDIFRTYPTHCTCLLCGSSVTMFVLFWMLLLSLGSSVTHNRHTANICWTNVYISSCRRSFYFGPSVLALNPDPLHWATSAALLRLLFQDTVSLRLLSCPGGTWTCHLLALISQSTEITDVHHHAWRMWTFLIVPWCPRFFSCPDELGSLLTKSDVTDTWWLWLSQTGIYFSIAIQRQADLATAASTPCPEAPGFYLSICHP